MAGNSSSNQEFISDINMTPFVDIVLVLLIILFVIAPTVMTQNIKMNLPKANTAEKQGKQKEALKVAIDKEAQVYINGQKVNENQIAELIKSKIADKNADIGVQMSADQSVSYGYVIKIIDILREQGLSQFSVDVQSTK